MAKSRIAIVLAVVLAVAAGAYYFWPRDPAPPPAAPRAEAPAAPPPAGPRYPVPAAAAASQPLPPLKESDAAVMDALAGLLGGDDARSFLWPDDVVRRIVATIDNLPRKSFAVRLNPLRPPGGLVKTEGADATLAIAADNAGRYSPYVRTVASIDAKRLVALYLALYPLFQQAYVELGYPNGYFNDRLVEVIDHLLATPDVPGPIQLTVRHVLYEFADPDLETRSAGQKLMLRIGAENASIVKAKLREIRGELAAQAAPR